MRINDINLTAHFNLREFECGCCQRVKLSPTLVMRLEELRWLWGRPLVVTSGYRCETHNKAVGGVENSRHTQGTAADIRVPESEQGNFYALAKRCGFTRIIRYESRNFVHLEE